MKKTTQSNILGIGLCALVLVLVGAGCAKVSNTDTTMMEKKEDTTQMQKMDQAMVDVKGDTNAMMEKENMAMEKNMMEKPAMKAEMPGTYENYSAEKIAFAAEGKVILFFYAPWCPTCKALDGDINAELSQIPSNTKILKVDYESSTELKKKYGVTYQHTLVQVDAQANMITKWSGGNTLESLLEKIK